MSNVITFPRKRREAAPATDAAPGPARILFFTGIRYVRDEEPAAVAAPAPMAVAEDRLQA